jgi:hypothetical protein
MNRQPRMRDVGGPQGARAGRTAGVSGDTPRNAPLAQRGGSPADRVRRRRAHEWSGLAHDHEARVPELDAVLQFATAPSVRGRDRGHQRPCAPPALGPAPRRDRGGPRGRANRGDHGLQHPPRPPEWPTAPSAVDPSRGGSMRRQVAPDPTRGPESWGRPAPNRWRTCRRDARTPPSPRGADPVTRRSDTPESPPGDERSGPPVTEPPRITAMLGVARSVERAALDAVFGSILRGDPPRCERPARARVAAPGVGRSCEGHRVPGACRALALGQTLQATGRHVRLSGSRIGQAGPTLGWSHHRW